MQDLEILGAAGTIRQANIQIAFLLAEWIVMLAMHRECKDTRLVLEEPGGTISLVHVQVNNKYLFNLACSQQVISSNGKVIQHTESFTAVCIGVVGASGSIKCNTLIGQGPKCASYC